MIIIIIIVIIIVTIMVVFMVMVTGGDWWLTRYWRGAATQDIFFIGEPRHPEGYWQSLETKRRIDQAALRRWIWAGTDNHRQALNNWEIYKTFISIIYIYTLLHLPCFKRSLVGEDWNKQRKSVYWPIRENQILSTKLFSDSALQGVAGCLATT